MNEQRSPHGVSSIRARALDILDLVPHEAPMVWLDELLEWAPGRARCLAVVRASSPFVEDGALDAVVLLEHMAQAVAVCLGYGALKSGESVRVGMVVACRSFEIDRPFIPEGSVLEVLAQSVREVDAVSNYTCTVHVDGARAAAAALTLYHASEPPS